MNEPLDGRAIQFQAEFADRLSQNFLQIGSRIFGGQHEESWGCVCVRRPGRHVNQPSANN
jgi:hypothetical protein